MNRGFLLLDTLIVPQIFRQNARRYFSNHRKILSPFKKLSLKKDGKNLVLLVLKSTFERKLNIVQNDFSVDYRGINYHL